MKILNILNALESVSGRNDKLSILQSNKDNESLKTFFYLALDPMVTFGIKKIPEHTQGKVTRTLEQAYEELKLLITRQVTGNAAINHLKDVLCSLYAEDAEVITRVIEKDPKCGVADSSVNKIWPNTVFEFPVMKAFPYDEKTIKNIEFPAYSQNKLDGARCCVVVEKDKVIVLSSSGREILTHGVFDWLMQSVTDNNSIVIDGELLVTEPSGKFMDRKKGNGIVNKAVKGTITPELAKQLHLVIFDIIPEKDWLAGKCNTPYFQRFAEVTNLQLRNNTSVVESKVVASESDAVKHFKELYDRGEEGTILKNMSGIWEGKRSKDQLKFKGILTCDLRVVRVEEGTGKNTGKVGALVCVSSDGELEVSVGTGLSDKDREEKFDWWVDQIVEVAYNERIISKSEGAKYSLFLPRLVRVRIDKTEADTLENISIKGE